MKLADGNIWKLFYFSNEWFSVFTLVLKFVHPLSQVFLWLQEISAFSTWEESRPLFEESQEYRYILLPCSCFSFLSSSLLCLSSFIATPPPVLSLLLLLSFSIFFFYLNFLLLSILLPLLILPFTISNLLGDGFFSFNLFSSIINHVHLTL